MINIDRQRDLYPATNGIIRIRQQPLSGTMNNITKHSVLKGGLLMWVSETDHPQQWQQCFLLFHQFNTSISKSDLSLFVQSSQGHFKYLFAHTKHFIDIIRRGFVIIGKRTFTGL